MLSQKSIEQEAIFGTTTCYPPIGWETIYDKYICHNLESFSKHELWLEMSNRFQNSIVERKRLVDGNRLEKTVKPTNKILIDNSNDDIWRNEERRYGGASTWGQGLNQQDLLHLRRNIMCYAESVSCLREGGFLATAEEDNEIRGESMSTIEEDDEEDECLPRPQATGCIVGNALMFDDLPESVIQKMSTGKQNDVIERFKPQAGAYIFGTETFLLPLRCQQFEGMDPASRWDEAQDAPPLLSNFDASVSFVDSKETSGTSWLIDQQAYSIGPRNGGLSGLSHEVIGAEHVEDKAQGQLQQRRPKKLASDVDPGKYLVLQRMQAFKEGFYDVIRAQNPQNSGTNKSQARERLDARSRALRLDARKLFEEIAADDIDVKSEPEFATLQRTKLQKLSERVNEIIPAWREYRRLLKSDEIESEFRVTLKCIIRKNADCYLKYHYDRSRLLRDSVTLDRLRKANMFYQYRRLLLHHLTLRRLAYDIHEAEQDPNRARWECCEDYERLLELDEVVKDHVEVVMEKRMALLATQATKQGTVSQPLSTLSEGLAELSKELASAKAEIQEVKCLHEANVDRMLHSACGSDDEEEVKGGDVVGVTDND